MYKYRAGVTSLNFSSENNSFLVKVATLLLFPSLPLFFHFLFPSLPHFTTYFLPLSIPFIFLVYQVEFPVEHTPTFFPPSFYTIGLVMWMRKYRYGNVKNVLKDLETSASHHLGYFVNCTDLVTKVK